MESQSNFDEDFQASGFRKMLATVFEYLSTILTFSFVSPTSHLGAEKHVFLVRRSTGGTGATSLRPLHPGPVHPPLARRLQILHAQQGALQDLFRSGGRILVS